MSTPVSTVITYDSDVPAHVSALAALITAGAVDHGAGIANGTTHYDSGIWDGTYNATGYFNGSSYIDLDWQGAGIYSDPTTYQATGIFDGSAAYFNGIFDGSDGTNGTRYDHGIWDVVTYSGDSGIFLEGVGIYPWSGAGVYDGSAGYNATGIFDGSTYNSTGILDADIIYHGTGIFNGAAYGAWSGSGIYDSTPGFQVAVGIWDGTNSVSSGIFDGTTVSNTGIFDGTTVYTTGHLDGSAVTPITDWALISGLVFPDAADVNSVAPMYGIASEYTPSLDIATVQSDSAAAQLVLDQAEIMAAVTSINDDVTLLQVQGNQNIATVQSDAAAAALATVVIPATGNVTNAETAYGLTGELAGEIDIATVQSDAAAAQLGTDQAEVSAVAGSIKNDVTGLLGTVDGTLIVASESSHTFA